MNAYLHQFLRSDDDRANDGHPWHNVSTLLRGRYREHTRYRVRGCRPAPSMTPKKPQGASFSHSDSIGLVGNAVQMMSVRLYGMWVVANADGALYAVLTPAQRKTANVMITGPMDAM